MANLKSASNRANRPMPESGRIPVPLRLCRHCRHFVRIENENCDFCGQDLAAAEAAHAAAMADLRRTADALRAALQAVATN